MSLSLEALRLAGGGEVPVHPRRAATGPAHHAPAIASLCDLAWRRGHSTRHGVLRNTVKFIRAPDDA